MVISEMVRPLKFGPDEYESPGFLGFRRKIVHLPIAESAIIGGRNSLIGKEKPAFAGFKNCIRMLRYANPSR
ncbi:hypothetical protein [Agrobacterium larrymoorei]|uniref:Uncharacterized protein n=1 Tax=Agrobacterium larrymoorei TaxID=160699 RepID=A0A4D7DQ36_9HYPH|nr:hypothetical protein [Agrobacterium larrymoorei]QCI98731.1 hypothetical protein CFBP5473_12990 [Agrobacterium larrymoorei]QYA08386.1 hypothetical protein J5285_06745 [Agrobacterium larrymoorei]